MLKVRCVATGRGREWEAFCVDFDLAVQGGSFEAVRRSLDRAIKLYVETASAQPAAVRARLLARKAPLWNRVVWACRVFWATLSIGARIGTGNSDVPATVATIACPA